jgi:hypothetical protein
MASLVTRCVSTALTIWVVMAKKVLRFSVEVTSGPQQLHYPLGGKIILVDSKSWGFVDIWVECAADAMETQLHTFEVYGTGHTISGDAEHVGSIVQRKEDHEGVVGTGVWHLYERSI